MAVPAIQNKAQSDIGRRAPLKSSYGQFDAHNFQTEWLFKLSLEAVHDACKSNMSSSLFLWLAPVMVKLSLNAQLMKRENINGRIKTHVSWKHDWLLIFVRKVR